MNNLRNVNKDEAIELRNYASHGVIIKELGKIYFRSFNTAREARAFLRTYPTKTEHLCGLSCEGFHPNGSNNVGICPKVLNVRCNHLELYDFIYDGLEVFWTTEGRKRSVFFVFGCSDYLSSNS